MRLRRLWTAVLSVCLIAGLGSGQDAISYSFPSKQEIQEVAKQSLQDFVPFNSPEQGLSIKYPKNWEKLTPTGTVICEFKVFHGFASYRVGVQPLPEGTTLDFYAKESVGALKTMMDAQQTPITTIEEGEAKLSTVPAHKSVYSYQIKGIPRTIKVLQYLAVQNNQGYVFNYTADSEMYDDLLGVINESVKSIEFSIPTKPPVAAGFPSPKEIQELARVSLQELVQFNSPEQGFSIKYPKSWENWSQKTLPLFANSKR